MNLSLREALESYQKKQLDAYMEFLKQWITLFKNELCLDFDHMDKVMTHFNELNTQGSEMRP